MSMTISGMKFKSPWKRSVPDCSTQVLAASLENEQLECLMCCQPPVLDNAAAAQPCRVPEEAGHIVRHVRLTDSKNFINLADLEQSTRE
jgi:hypothetical protein